MNRRSFLSAAGLLPMSAALPALANGPIDATGRPLSRAAQRGWLPNVPLTAHTGETFHFYDDLVRDRIILLNFFVVQCREGRCPAVNQTLRKVQDMMGDRMGRDVFFYSVTLEPEKDTVPILKEYAEDIFEVGPGWLFFTGTHKDIELLRRRQGFIDRDPERDADVSNHASSGRLIMDRADRWSMIPLLTSPQYIHSLIKTI